GGPGADGLDTQRRAAPADPCGHGPAARLAGGGARPLRGRGEAAGARQLGSRHGRRRRPQPPLRVEDSPMVQVAAPSTLGEAAAGPSLAPLCCPGGAIAAAAGSAAEGLTPADYESHIATRPDGSAELTLIVQNLQCPSCIHTIESALTALPGVEGAR